jgi:hypothetical protein
MAEGERTICLVVWAASPALSGDAAAGLTGAGESGRSRSRRANKGGTAGLCSRPFLGAGFLFP